MGTPGNLERFTERPRKTVRVANSRIVVRRLLFRPITTAHMIKSRTFLVNVQDRR